MSQNAITEQAAIPTGRAALAGTLAGAAALAAGEILGGIAGPRPGPVIAVANRVVDKAPTWFVDFGKSVFGLDDKAALVVGTILISLLLGAVFGILSRRSRLVGALGFAAFGVVGFLAIANDARGGIISGFFIAAGAVAVGIATLLTLLNRATLRPAPSSATLTPGTQAKPIESPVDPALSRRSFVGWAGVTGALVVGGSLAARALRGRSVAAEARDTVNIAPVGTASDIADQVTAAEAHPVAQTPNITPVVVPNDRFYRIDTAVWTPQVDPTDWELKITGMVDSELSFTYQDLIDRANTVAPVTLSCVSNEIGGDLVGNAVWQGVPLTDLLDEAGVQQGATQIRSSSVDGWDCGFPTDLAYDGRTALVAVAMNGEPLPINHGFPARLVVSGLYGYVSATKWLSEIEMTTLEDFDGYWIPRGWSKLGPVKTQSRIDTPLGRTIVTPGVEIPIAGVAWAPHLGIDAVEVNIDGNGWIAAELGESLGKNAWRQWYLPWTPTKGDHVIAVRATDGGGTVQTSEITAPAPNGSSGWHTIAVRSA